MAGGCEAALYYGVVFGEVAECEGVADCGCDGGWIESELGVCSDGDGVVGGEGERKERE